MYWRYVVSGRVLWVNEKYIVTTEGIFNRNWYRLPGEMGANDGTVDDNIA